MCPAVISRSLYQPAACKSARPVCEGSSIGPRFPAGSPNGVIIRVIADWLQCRWRLRRDIRVTRARTLLQYTSLQVARRVGWPTEAFGSIRPSTHIFEPKGDSLPIDPAIHTDIEVGGSHPPDSVHWMSAIEGLLQVTADSSLWSTPHGLEVAKD